MIGVNEIGIELKKRLGYFPFGANSCPFMRTLPLGNTAGNGGQSLLSTVVTKVSSSLKELSSAIYDFVFSSLGQFRRSVIILLLAAGVMVGAHGNNEIPGSPS
jgi:hypothetical protein